MQEGKKEILVSTSRSDSLFFSGSAYGKDIDWLVDTGCSVTLILTGVYYDFPKQQRPKLSNYDRVLTQASGTLMQVLGKVSMTVKVGKQRLKHTVVIAVV